ncbi:MAG: hypothetical protein Q8N61_03090 [bacterium]|nr:hypothetical protein [bacterium]
MKKKEVGGVPGNVFGMMADLASKLQNGAITPGQFGRFLKKENSFVVGDYAELIADWQEFYRELGINCSLSGVTIPDDPGGFGRVIIVAQGITPQSVFNLCVKNFPCWKYTNDDLDKIVTSDRIAKDGAYAIWVRDRVEADEELKNMSANDLKRQNIAGITLEERLVYELKFFKETSKHLDIQNVTLCTGSRYSDGLVPYVSWRGDKLRVHWCHPAHAHGYLHSRQTVF